MRHTRRYFMAVVSLAAVGVRTPRLVAAHELAARRLTVLFDAHLADSRAFARRACMTGARSVALSGDIGEMWFELLAPASGAEETAFAGLTRHADAFVFSRLAQGAGMQMTQRTAGPLIMWRLDPFTA